jgi:feruloyl esterase
MLHHRICWVIVITLFALTPRLALAQAAQFVVACEAMTATPIDGGTITTAQIVEANSVSSAPDHPAFCRLQATLTPSPDSDIQVEVWMPITGWNGKFHAAGGFLVGDNISAIGGSINTTPMLEALRAGYATAGTDGGNKEATLSFAPGHPEKLIDFGYRAVHEMTIAAKAVITNYYGMGPKFSYWNACGGGGRQGWMEVQRYPDDYDGLIVGDPANYWTHLQAWSLWVYQATHDNEASYIPPEKYPVIHEAALAACDARDGVKDNVIDSPNTCQFDPGVITCDSGDDLSCLTTAQVEAARRIYAPVVNPRTGEEIFPGLFPGSELVWDSLAGERVPYYASETFRHLVYDDPNWTPATRPVDFSRDVDQADERVATVLNANDPDLQPFFARGGKIVAYGGWADHLISPLNQIQFYERVAAALGGRDKIDDAYRLFMVPGMNHCQGGKGTDTFDMLAVLEAWVERNETPNRIEASHVEEGVVQKTRPLCPYPQVATYIGRGNTNDAENFVCSMP